MRLTRRGVAVSVLALPLLVFGLWGGYPFLRALGAILLGAVLAAVLLTARRMPVAVRRSVYPDRVERGRPGLATLRVSNPSGNRRAAFLATDPAGSATRTIRVRALLPGAEAVHHYEVPTSTRGRLTVGPLTLHREDPFGLTRNRLPTGETATLWVHPRQLPARVAVGGHPRHHHEGTTTDADLRGSVDLQDVREYVPGDEVRHLHWKATARTGRLMVRDLADPQQPRFTLLLDTRADALTDAAFEEAVDLAASLLSAAARTGHHSRLVTSSGLDLPTPGGARAARRLLDELSELRQDGKAGGNTGRGSGAGGNTGRGSGAGGNSAVTVSGPLSTDRSAGGCLVVVTAGTTELAPLGPLRHRFTTIFAIALTGPEAAPAPVAGVRLLCAGSAHEAVRRWNEVVT